MMLEDEARTKCCPHATGFAASEGARSEYATERRGGLPLGRCVASDCMAWRWSNRTLGHDIEYQTQKHGSVKGAQQHQSWTAANPLRGFCGLAGVKQ